MKAPGIYGHKAQLKILALIEAAASEGSPAPSHADIAAELGVDPSGKITRTLNEMAYTGMIRVQRSGQSWRYYATLTGAWTGWSESARSKPAAPKRKCLSCSTPFRPTHKTNRLCVSCKRIADNASPLASAGGWLYSDGRV